MSNSVKLQVEGLLLIISNYFKNIVFQILGTGPSVMSSIKFLLFKDNHL